MRRSCLIALAFLLMGTRAFSLPEEGFVESQGVKVRYVVQGEGEPVVLVHGFTGTFERNWGFVVPALAPKYRVIGIDCRGHGKSDKPRDAASYGREMADDVARVLDKLKIESAHIAGYSMGAMIAAKFVALYPKRVRSAILGGAGPVRAGPSTAFYEGLARSLETGKGMGILLRGLSPPGQALTEEQVSAANRALETTQDTKALAAVVRGWKDLALSDSDLAAIRTRIVAIVGSQDPLKASIDLAKGRIKGLKVLVIPGANHMSAVIRPEFSKAIEDFLGGKPVGQ